MKESDYILEQRARENEVREAQEQLESVIVRFRGLPAERMPPLWMMQKIGSHSEEHFKNTATWSFRELVRRGRCRTSSNIIDIGSGCGRLALPFAELVKTGTYYGTDVFSDGIAWCQQNISNTHPNFKFVPQSVEHNYYFGGEAKPSSTLTLGFVPDRSIDFVFSISVFTHLVEADAQTYLREIARCLKPDAIAYITAFIIDDPFHAFVRRTGKHKAVKPVSEGHFQAYAGQDFLGGYTMDRWRHIIESAGLSIYGFDPGTWAEKPGSLHYQDTFILRLKS